MPEHPEEETEYPANERIFLGVSDLYVGVGESLGHFYQTREEWQAILLPFLKTGLDMGDQCIYLMRPEQQEELCEALAATRIRVEDVLASKQLILETNRVTFEEFHAWLTATLAALPRRFRRLRWGGDMTSVLMHIPPGEQCTPWSSIRNLIPSLPTVSLCQYDLTRLQGSAVIAALKAHPLCIVGTIVHRRS